MASAIWATATRRAVRSSRHPAPNAAFLGESSYALYANGQATGTLDATFLGWVDDSHFLAAAYSDGDEPTQGTAYLYDVDVIPQQTVTLPDLRSTPVSSLGGTLVYAPSLNEIVDYSTGNVVWAAPTTDASDSRYRVATGDYVVTAGNQIVAYRWR